MRIPLTEPELTHLAKLNSASEQTNRDAMEATRLAQILTTSAKNAQQARDGFLSVLALNHNINETEFTGFEIGKDEQGPFLILREPEKATAQ